MAYQNVYLENYQPEVREAGQVKTKFGITALAGTATTAGGAVLPAITLGLGALGVYFGSGAPTITAPQGSLYLNTTGSSTSTRMYINTTGSTTWTAVTTVG